MEQEYAIEVKHISKSFKVYLDKGHELKERVIFRKRGRHETREVLKDISFSVKKGEAIGLIGHNGGGKSTTLKLLTKIMYPDSGTITMRGRVSSLIELGAGFHPDMSGTENIYINASIFGLTRKEIDRRLDDIIAFSELEEFIDNPVRTYSSGMYMRLAFSVAINVDADILLVDEILAVGDVNFQAKCFNRMREIKADGTTIVIVSHSLGQIEQICERSLWIDKGKVRDEGIPKYVHEHYLKTMEDIRLEHVEKETEKETEKELQEELPSFCSPRSIRIGNKQISFSDVKLTDRFGNEKKIFKTGESFMVKMSYESREKNLQANFGIGIFRDDGVHIYGTNTLIECDCLVDIEESGTVAITVTDNCLLPANYMLDVAIHSRDGIRYDDIRNIVPFVITAAKQDVGVCRLDNHWTVNGETLAKRSYEN